MRTRRIIGVVFAVGILCFCFAGSIDNSATRPWVTQRITERVVVATQTIAGASVVGAVASAVTATNADWAITASSSSYAGYSGYAQYLFDAIDDVYLYPAGAWYSEPAPGTTNWIMWAYNRALYGSWTNYGSLTVTGAVTVSRVVQTTGDWDDLNFPAVESARVGVDDIEFNTASNGLVFKTSCTTNLTDDHELRMVHFPHSWATNTAVKPHIHFVQTSADHTNMFFLRYKWYDNGSLVPSTWTDLGYASNTLAYTSGEMVQIAVWPQIQEVRGISSIMDVKIYRNGSVGTGDVLEKQFDIHIRHDSFGSTSEFTK